MVFGVDGVVAVSFLSLVVWVGECAVHVLICDLLGG